MPVKGVRKTTRAASATAEAPAKTKEQLLQAFEDVVVKAREKEEGVVSTKAAEEERRRQEKVVAGATQGTVETVVKAMTDLKLEVVGTVDHLADKMMGAKERLDEIHEAIELETGRLQELYEITVAADTLSLLIRDYESKKAAFEAEEAARLETAKRQRADDQFRFETEMAEKRDAWKKEQDLHAAALKDRDALVKKERDREEEEFTYKLKRTRQLDADNYKAQQEVLQKQLAAIREKQETELSAREQAVVAREEELKRLQVEVESFPARLDAAVKQADKDATRRTEERARIDATLASHEAEAAANLAKLRIENLEKVVKEKETLAAGLQAKLEQASAKVSDIAIKAIEGASGGRALLAVNEIALEQAKHQGSK